MNTSDPTKVLRDGILSMVGLTLVALAAIWLLSSDERENNEHINQAIFPAFRSIENSCLAERFPRQTVRCSSALELMLRCGRQQDGCTAREYYEQLHRAGFDLPPFYEPGYVPR